MEVTGEQPFSESADNQKAFLNEERWSCAPLIKFGLVREKAQSPLDLKIIWALRLKSTKVFTRRPENRFTQNLFIYISVDGNIPKWHLFYWNQVPKRRLNSLMADWQTCRREVSTSQTTILGRGHPGFRQPLTIFLFFFFLIWIFCKMNSSESSYACHAFLKSSFLLNSRFKNAEKKFTRIDEAPNRTYKIICDLFDETVRSGEFSNGKRKKSWRINCQSISGHIRLFGSKKKKKKWNFSRNPFSRFLVFLFRFSILKTV